MSYSGGNLVQFAENAIDDFIEFQLEYLHARSTPRNGFLLGIFAGSLFGSITSLILVRFFRKKDTRKISESSHRRISRHQSMKDIPHIRVEMEDNTEETGNFEREREERYQDLEKIAITISKEITGTNSIQELEAVLDSVRGDLNINLEDLSDIYWPILFEAAILKKNFEIATQISDWAISSRASSRSNSSESIVSLSSRHFSDFSNSSGKALQSLLLIQPRDQSTRERLQKLALTIIDLGANPSVFPNDDGENGYPLDLAVERGYIQLVNKIVHHHTNPLNVLLSSSSPKSSSLPTPLHRAVRNNDLDILKIFLKLKSPLVDQMIGTCDSDGKSILHIAAEAKLVLIFPHVLEDPRTKKFVNIQDRFGNTPLHYAAKNKNVEMFRLLIVEKGDPNITNYENESAFGIAIANGFPITI